MIKNIKRESRCRYCGKYFNWLGIARHETMHSDKLKRERLKREEGEKRK